MVSFVWFVDVVDCDTGFSLTVAIFLNEDDARCFCDCLSSQGKFAVVSHHPFQSKKKG